LTDIIWNSEKLLKERITVSSWRTCS